MALAALGLFLLIVRNLEPVHLLPLPWWALAAMFALAEVFVVQFEIRRGTVSFSLSEIPLVLGLFFASPSGLVVGQVAGAAAALALHRRQKPIKLAFNLSLLALQACLAVALFHPILSLGDPLGPAGWLATLTVTHTLDVVSSFMVSLAISLTEAKSLTLRGLLGVGTAVTFANTGLALLAVIIVWAHPASSWLLLVAAGVVFLGLHAHGSLRRAHKQLRVLYESNRAAEGAPDVESMLSSILAGAREMLRAEVAEITLFGDAPGEPGSRITLGPGDRRSLDRALRLDPREGVWARVVAQEQGVVLARPMRHERPHTRVAATPVDDAVVVPLRTEEGIIGTMLVGNRLEDQETFGEDDLALLETIARQTSVTLEKGRLLERLREEAAANEYMAQHDLLTGLPNRVRFLDRLDQAIEEAAATETCVAVVLIDLDRFKEVNDTLGHHNGDELLKEIGRRLAGAVGDELVARLGGDEFAVLRSSVADRETAIREGRTIVRSLHIPFEVEGLQVDVSASAGVAVFPADGLDASTLLQRADVAMYLAKEARTECEPYASDRDPYSPTRLTLVGDLRTAVENQEVFLVYQPLLDLRTGGVAGVEALARWEHPRLGLIPPSQFIPIAEHTGTIKRLTLLALETALSERRSSLAAVLGEVPVSVNLSARMLQSEEFPLEVIRLLERYGVPRGGLCLELTESSIMADPDRSRNMLTRLSEAGVRVSIDDFGTGYSSLSYLSRLALDELKIDRSFVSRMVHDSRDASIVESTISLGHALGLSVVAEGVEDEERLRILARMGCDVAQGYHVGLPSSPDALGTWAQKIEGMGSDHTSGVESLAEHRVRRQLGS
jgi:diguanylate cyclase (GGDEF)-like protein